MFSSLPDGRSAPNGDPLTGTAGDCRWSHSFAGTRGGSGSDRRSDRPTLRSALLRQALPLLGGDPGDQAGAARVAGAEDRGLALCDRESRRSLEVEAVGDEHRILSGWWSGGEQAPQPAGQVL